jgi:3',5'-cyclic AMP phosphodiesterase CpdA
MLAVVIVTVSFILCQAAYAGDPHSAFYSPENNRIFWFIQISDIHIGTSGSQDHDYLMWIVTDANSIIEPEFIVASGDLTDSTNANIFGFPNGPYQEEWDEYKAILAGNVDAGFYYDIPGNHDAYNDQYFSYYRANSIQGQATGNTQISWTRTFSFGTYHFLGINSADNTGDPFSLFWPWGDYAGLDADELTYINAHLALNQDAALTLIFGHHPVTDTGYSNDTWLYYGAPAFIHYLDIYGASMYGYGHTHRSEEDLFAGDDYTGYMLGDGIFYFNVPSLGKSNDWHYSIIAVDCNGISCLTQAKGVWPAVLITAPVDHYLGSALNPYAYAVPSSNANPIRALVFDANPIGQVQYRIVGSADWNDMTRVSANPHLWEALWDTTALQSGDYTLEVRATSASGMMSDLITVTVEANPDCNNNGVCDAAETPCTCPTDCGPPPSSESNCSDGVDEDCDGWTDCDDPTGECDSDPACQDTCGNDICDVGEDCVLCPGDCISGAGGGVCGNSVCEPEAGEDCLACPDDCAGQQGGKPSKRFCCGDGDGQNPVGCEDSRCTDAEFDCGSTAVSYCCGDGVCEGNEDSYTCEVDCGPPPICGDGFCDPGEDICNCSVDCGNPSPENCDDGIDNDCDGHTDCGDTDCSDNPLCSCVEKKSPCEQDSDCCSNKCSIKGVCL